MKKIAFLLFVLFGLIVSCKRDDEVYTVGGKNGVNPNSLFSIISVSPIVQEADTASLIIIKLKIPTNADTIAHTINVSTTLGTFVNGKTTTTMTANAQGMAQAFLRSGSVGSAQLAFTDQNFTVDTVITFVPALADDFLLSSDKYSGDTTVSFNITVTLTRNDGRGVVTNPDKVWFNIVPATAGATLVCPAFASSAKSMATVVVTNPYGIKGNFTLNAKTLNDAGDTLRKSLTLIIK